MSGLTTSYTNGKWFLTRATSQSHTYIFIKKNYRNNSLTWYNENSSESQFNYANYTYYYFYLG